MYLMIMFDKIQQYIFEKRKLIKQATTDYLNHSHNFLYVLEQINSLEIFYDEHLYRAPLRRQYEKESKKLDSLICIDCGDFKNTYIPLGKHHRCKHMLTNVYWITREFI